MSDTKWPNWIREYAVSNLYALKPTAHWRELEADYDGFLRTKCGLIWDSHRFGPERDVVVLPKRHVKALCRPCKHCFPEAA